MQSQPIDQYSEYSEYGVTELDQHIGIRRLDRTRVRLQCNATAATVGRVGLFATGHGGWDGSSRLSGYGPEGSQHVLS